MLLRESPLRCQYALNLYVTWCISWFCAPRVPCFRLQPILLAQNKVEKVIILLHGRNKYSQIIYSFNAFVFVEFLAVTMTSDI